MADEPSWDDIFRPAGEPVRPTTTQADWRPEPQQAERVSGLVDPAERPAEPRATEPAAYPSRRAMREAEQGRGGGRDGGGRDGGARGRGDRERGGRDPLAPKRRRRWPWVVGILVLVLGLGAGAAAYVWLNYEDQVRQVLGWELPNDYTGSGNGQEIVVVVQSGDIGEDVARALADAGVTMTFDAVYDILLEHPEYTFEPGNYRLQGEMSAQAAIDALLDPANKIVDQVTIPEGTALPDALALVASATGLSVEELSDAAADPSVYGVPATAPDLEGWLFPATYTFDPGVTAQDAIQQMVDRMVQELDDLGVSQDPTERENTLILASIVQRESGGTEDMPKIARVFLNRIDQGMRLQSDATVAYGTGNTHTVWTTDAERADASNPYNTYANDGLPVGPIGLPGSAAIQSVISPADGPWLYFVPINLKTGETVFSETAEEHEAAAQQLRDWCNASAENDAYCQ
ncbi:MAG: endolytic transglycosylase MltG [Actinomycetales bacterium]|nr:endolytic transglycosylase MltG [Actinomycetales bacterium]